MDELAAEIESLEMSLAGIEGDRPERAEISAVLNARRELYAAQLEVIADLSRADP